MLNWNGNSDFEKPLEGMLVLDFSQFLSGPSAALRLADLGARVIKIERPEGGDICRTLYVSNLVVDHDSSLFHAINRNKESFAADLKKPENVGKITRLIEKADVLIQNFRPSVMQRLGLHYDAVKEINPKIVYGSVTGYGTEGPWKNAPGQDLLVQARSGITWLNGNEDDFPVPFGLAIADMIAGAHLVQGILAACVRRAVSGNGAHVEVSLLESIIDFQFTALTAYLNDSGQKPHRANKGNTNECPGDPFGIYETTDGFIAMSGHQCAEVLSWDELMEHEGFQVLDMLQEVRRNGGPSIRTTRCPIRMDGKIYKSSKGSPRNGEDTERILKEFMQDS